MPTIAQRSGFSMTGVMVWGGYRNRLVGDPDVTPVHAVMLFHLLVTILPTRYNTHKQRLTSQNRDKLF